MLSATLAYAAALVPEIADDVVAVDEAMRWGYTWKFGPFELIDQIGVDTVIALLKAGKIEVPPLLQKAAGKTFYRTADGTLEYLTATGAYAPVRRRPGVLLLADIKRKSKPVARNGSASLWDIGDGVLCLEFHTKMNALDGDSIASSCEKGARDRDGQGRKALVIYNEGGNFSLGANIGLILFAANVGLWPVVDDAQASGQAAYKALKYAPFPVVAAPAGMALGGGCEICLHSSAIQAHAELYIGLVEVGVGLVPGWGGCKELVLRLLLNPKRPQGPMPPLRRRPSRPSRSPRSAARNRPPRTRAGPGLLLQGDRRHQHEPRPAARRRQGAPVLALATGYRPPEPAADQPAGPDRRRPASSSAVGDFAAPGQGHGLRHGGVGPAAPRPGAQRRRSTDATDETSEDAVLALERDAHSRPWSATTGARWPASSTQLGDRQAPPDP